MTTWLYRAVMSRQRLMKLLNVPYVLKTKNDKSQNRCSCREQPGIYLHRTEWTDTTHLVGEVELFEMVTLAVSISSLHPFLSTVNLGVRPLPISYLTTSSTPLSLVRWSSCACKRWGPCNWLHLKLAWTIYYKYYVWYERKVIMSMSSMTLWRF